MLPAASYCGTIQPGPVVFGDFGDFVDAVGVAALGEASACRCRWRPGRTSVQLPVGSRPQVSWKANVPETIAVWSLLRTRRAACRPVDKARRRHTSSSKFWPSEPVGHRVLPPEAVAAWS